MVSRHKLAVPTQYLNSRALSFALALLTVRKWRASLADIQSGQTKIKDGTSINRIESKSIWLLHEMAHMIGSDTGTGSQGKSPEVLQ